MSYSYHGFHSFQFEDHLLRGQNSVTDLTSLAVVRNRLGTAGVTELGLAASSYRAINAQLLATIYGMTTKTSATLAAVRNVVRTIGRMAVWLKSTMSLIVPTSQHSQQCICVRHKLQLNSQH